MKILLTAINAKYIHSNLALYSIKAYAKDYSDHLKIVEFTINNSLDYILRSIYQEEPDVVALSCYIWNKSITMQLCMELKKIIPDCQIWLGGPEVSYNANQLLKQNSTIDGIIVGEGEATFLDLIRYYLHEIHSLDTIKGIVYKGKDLSIKETKLRPLLALDKVPFVYENVKLSNFENKIIYYESSRGCPFCCQYCLSSIDRSIRFRSYTKVFEELIKFINSKVKQVKFVDRTFNCNKKHAMEIWQFLHKNDNGITNYHFEIAADLIDDDMLLFLKNIRAGLFQFEIGVQSTHLPTLNSIQRKMDFERVCKVVKTINEFNNIHQHLDLIAGLPKETYEIFKKSFNDVYELKPEQLQLGFLKVLKGSGLQNNQKEYQLVYKGEPPYEILSTKEMSYKDILNLKMVEEMLEMYYNSGQFTHTIRFLERFFSTPFNLFETLAKFYQEEDYHLIQHSRIKRYTILLEFYKNKIDKNIEIFKSYLITDLYLQENLKKRPNWIQDNDFYKNKIRNFFIDEEKVRKILPHYKKYSIRQISRLTHIEVLPINILEKYNEININNNKPIFILFDYLKRNPLNNHAKWYRLEL